MGVASYTSNLPLGVQWHIFGDFKKPCSWVAEIALITGESIANSSNPISTGKLNNIRVNCKMKMKQMGMNKITKYYLQRISEPNTSGVNWFINLYHKP